MTGERSEAGDEQAGPLTPAPPAARSYVPYVDLRLGARFETGVRRRVTRARLPIAGLAPLAGRASLCLDDVRILRIDPATASEST
jgi:hypothetical protein